jgi:hypothetical protein
MGRRPHPAATARGAPDAGRAAARLDTHVQGEKRKDGDGEDGAAGALVPAGSQPLMARRPGTPLDTQGPSVRETGSDLGLLGLSV